MRVTVTVRESRAILPKPLNPYRAEPVWVDGNVRPPRTEVDLRPVYPTAMHAADRTGAVPIEAIM